MVNESTNQTMDQHLIISYCILNLKGKEAAIVSFVELSVIENYGGGIYTLQQRTYWNHYSGVLINIWL